MSKRNNIVISDWVAIFSIVLIVASYVWTLSSKVSGIEHRIQRVEEIIKDLSNDLKRINSHKIPAVEYRNTQAEKRLDKLELRMQAVEEKQKP